MEIKENTKTEIREEWERDTKASAITIDTGESRQDRIFTFDIETYQWTDKNQDYIIEKRKDKRLKDPVKIEENILKIKNSFALSPLTGQIILSGFYDGEDFTVFTGREPDIISSTFEYIIKKLVEGHRLVTKGGKRFDLPFLLMRAGINFLEIKFPYSYKDLLNKYFNFYHIDLETIFEGSLASWGYAFGTNESPENEGNRIAEWYNTNQFDKIIEKNKDDLVTTFKIYERIKWINL